MLTRLANVFSFYLILIKLNYKYISSITYNGYLHPAYIIVHIISLLYIYGGFIEMAFTYDGQL